MSSFIAGFLIAITSEPSVLSSPEPTLAYLGPETLMPVASALAALGGLLLLFWRRIVGQVRRFLRVFSKRTSRRIPE